MSPITETETIAKILEVIHSSPLRKKIRSISLFGSRAKGTARPDSDIDLLVDFDGHKGLGFPLVRLVNDLEDQLGGKVDFLTPESISKFLHKEIMTTKKIIYER